MTQALSVHAVFRTETGLKVNRRRKTITVLFEKVHSIVDAPRAMQTSKTADDLNSSSPVWEDIDPLVLESYPKRSRELMECTEEFQETLRALHGVGQQDIEIIWNVACQVNLIAHDLLSLIYFMSRRNDSWAQRTLCRALATLVHEAVEDLQQIFGKDFLQACATAGVPEPTMRTLKATKKELSAFGQKHKTLVKGIRMTSGAHRDHSVVSFMTSVDAACPDRFLSIASEFNEVLYKLAACCHTIIDDANEFYRKKGVIV
jgi:hypothetical protein